MCIRGCHTWFGAMHLRRTIGDPMLDTEVEHIFINLSKRSIKILDKEGYDKTIEWEWNEDGADDFTETISCICDCVDTDLITYCFAETE